jgi:hypothetical protein
MQRDSLECQKGVKNSNSPVISSTNTSNKNNKSSSTSPKLLSDITSNSIPNEATTIASIVNSPEIHGLPLETSSMKKVSSPDINLNNSNNNDANPLYELNEDYTKTVFWRTLKFWQRTSEVENIDNSESRSMQTRSNNQNEEVPQINDTADYTANEAVLTKSILIQNPTTVLTEETVAPANAPQEDETIPSTINDNSNFIWDITRRVSYLPFLQTKEQGNDESFTPNKFSEVIGINQVSNDLGSTTPDTKGNTNEPSKSDLWWAPWKWDFPKFRVGGNGDSVSEVGGVIEDELLKLQRKEIANQIKIQSYGIPKSVTWGSFTNYGESCQYVSITGNSYKKPVMMKKMPPSMFELNEQSIIKKVDMDTNDLTVNESIVLPEIGWNYRDFTWRTKFRIGLSKIPKFNNFFTPQVHLYSDNSLKKKSKNSAKCIKKVVVLCFHGFLPQKIVKNIIGEPTGTAEQMNEMAVKELGRWSVINNVTLEVSTINLEGNGKLFERVNGCLSILDNWLNNLSDCDYLLAVSSSHSVPLAIHVLSRLVISGTFENIEKMGFIGLSGICMGPIPEVESKISTRGSVGQDDDIISEMFDLEDPDSLQSKEIIRNMKILIKKNFKITFVGSLNDCFSPLYSSLGLHLIHPNIYRALYVDGKDHQPDFLVSLFNLILTVKNLNYKDHGLLLELSNFFTGQIGNGGHSKVLNNKYGYRIGINNMLNTSNLLYQQELIEELTNFREYSTNSYHIPWCLRGFLEELEKLQKHFDIRQIIEQLFEEFKSWEPENPKKKDLKYCMQAFENVLNEDLGL